MKPILLAIANILSLIWRMIPEPLRHLLLKGLFVLESRGGDTGNALKRLFTIQDDLEHVVNERAMAHGKGEHPKHRLIRYHDFFIECVKDGEAVIDIGCGYGAVARSVAKARPNARVIGVDYDDGRFAQAQASDNPPNLSFVKQDALISVPEGPWDVVILSNVLEHIKERPQFLARLKEVTGAGRFLIRVPLFERDWKMPLRRELGSNYYSDPDHKIEHTVAEFRSEMVHAGLVVEELNLIWGEIWAKMKPALK